VRLDNTQKQQDATTHDDDDLMILEELPAIDSPMPNSQMPASTHTVPHPSPLAKSIENIPTTQELIIQNIIKKFHDSISISPIHPCQSCDKLMYPHQRYSAVISDQLSIKFQQLGTHIPSGTKLSLCLRCKTWFAKNKVPLRAVANKLSVDKIPDELACLSEYEIRLICQVKLYMKIYNLCKGRGQKALHGLAIHFPQDVDEVVDQLPLTGAQSGVAFVKETLEGLDKYREYQVSLPRLFKALTWLKSNNPLYKNVKINTNTTAIEYQLVTQIQAQNADVSI